MTSTVIVKAHCSSTKQVVVTKIAQSKVVEVVIQDGESYQDYIYDNITIAVREEEKEIGK